MKPLVFLWMLFAGVSAFAAGEATIKYKIIITPSSTSAGGYSCSLEAMQDTLFWQKNDLITWIFPDGQYLQSEDTIGGGAAISQVVTWKPFKSPVYKDSIFAYVARKGKPGNPARVAVLATDFSITRSASEPEKFSFPAGIKWQLNRSWDFSPNNETLLIFSYDPQGCSDKSRSDFTPGTVNINFDPKQIIMLDTISFGKEQVDISVPNSPQISQLSSEPYYRHVFFKVKLQPTVQLGDKIDINLNTENYCGNSFESTYSYIVAADPHDPNWKVVDIDTIDANGPAVVLNYTIQYHNNGAAPVNRIDVDDRFPAQIDPSTFAFTSMPIKGSQSSVPTFPESDHLHIEFGNMNLPGLNQHSPSSYGYDQTIFRFSFKVLTKPNLNITFPNNATITFYDSAGDPMMPIITDPATVYTQSPQQKCPRCCCGLFCWIRKWCHRRK